MEREKQEGVKSSRSVSSHRPEVAGEAKASGAGGTKSENVAECQNSEWLCSAMVVSLIATRCVDY